MNKTLIFAATYNEADNIEALIKKIEKHSKNTDILILHDELDIDIGSWKFKAKGGAGGHNGIKSIQKHIEGAVSRIKIGIRAQRPSNMSGADFVLGKFANTEKEQLDLLFPVILSRVEIWLKQEAQS